MVASFFVCLFVSFLRWPPPDGDAVAPLSIAGAERPRRHRVEIIVAGCRIGFRPGLLAHLDRFCSALTGVLLAFSPVFFP